MEFLNLKTFEKSLAATKLKQSSKIVIRDVDETSKNNFVAYADDKNESFDISIEIDENDDIIDGNCDCGINGLCLHRIAMMIYLNNQKTKPKVVRQKKQTPTEILVNNLDINALRNWVNNLLKKNKDLDFLFTNEFSINTEEYDVKKVKLLIENSIKSVIKTRKNIETNELKKIIDLLEVTLKPVIDYCQNDTSEKEKIEILLSIFDEMLAFDERIYSSSVKIVRFVEKISNQVIDNLSSNNDEVKFQKITNFHFEIILNENVSSTSLWNFNHLKLLYSKNLDNQVRKKHFAEKIKNYTLNIHAKKSRFDVRICYFTLKVLFENDLFESTYQCFQAIRYENDYNLSLIDKLLAINKIDVAEKTALAQIASNYYVEYNFPYWQRLKSIYISQNNQKNLIKILINTVPVEMNFEDFLIVKKEMPETDFKKYKSNLMGKTKRNFYVSNKESEFYFKILAEDRNYKKMQESIGQYTDYDLIFDFKTQLFTNDKIEFLVAVSQIESNSYYRAKIYNEEYRDKLIDWFIENFDKPMLERVLKTYTKNLNSKFMDLLSEKFKNSIS